MLNVYTYSLGKRAVFVRISCKNRRRLVHREIRVETSRYHSMLNKELVGSIEGLTGEASR
jgi:hypothetical protein